MNSWHACNGIYNALNVSATHVYLSVNLINNFVDKDILWLQIVTLLLLVYGSNRPRQNYGIKFVELSNQYQ
jgi:hypothetical protein